MKKHILVAFAAIAIHSGYAQQGPAGKEHANPPRKAIHDQKPKTAEEKARQQADHLDKAVGLTPQQKAQVHDAALKKHNRVQKANETHKAEMKAAQQDYRNEVDKILTPEQKTRLEQHRDEMKDKRNAGPKGKPALVVPDDAEEDTTME